MARIRARPGRRRSRSRSRSSSSSSRPGRAHAPPRSSSSRSSPSSSRSRSRSSSSAGATTPRPIATVDPSPRLTLTDIVRVLGGVVLLSSLLSYLITNQSLSWNLFPTTRPRWTQAGYLLSRIRGPIQLTPSQLARYNGRDDDDDDDGRRRQRPIYLAINGSVYDVSASPAFYGPGGAYAFFAGRDATRAFVTGCFGGAGTSAGAGEGEGEGEFTPDLRGVEDMFLPVEDDEEDDEGESAAQRKIRREQEVRAARKKVHDSVAHWERFFAHNPKYFKIGTVRRDPGWLDAVPRRELCEAAKARRGESRRRVREREREREREGG
ncbi:MAG: hypothetical protein M1826_007758 [Phylliscum demangeonii]|nr:MAG: hypothetical protein M1826_007758 [Phylliscum demangeonii]